MSAKAVNCYILFLLTWTVEFTAQVSGQCNGSTLELDALNVTEGIITSTRLTDHYNKSDVRCSWLITAPPDRRVTLTVSLSTLRPRDSNGRCSHHVRVLDGWNSTSQLIVEWCGVENPESITSSGGALYVEFVSDDVSISSDEYGLYMTYSSFVVGHDCPNGWTLYNDHCYKLRNLIKQSWQNAQTMCTYDAANLCSVADDLENYFMADAFGAFGEDSDCAWIGLQDFSTSQRSYEWVDGLNSTYLGFSYDYYEDYALYACTVICFSDGYWHKRACGSRQKYICKKRIDGTTVRHTVPQTADFSNGLEFVAIATVVIMILIFIALVWSFIILNAKSCKKYRSKGDILIPSYSRVKEHPMGTGVVHDLPSVSDSSDSKYGDEEYVNGACATAHDGPESLPTVAMAVSKMTNTGTDNSVDLKTISAATLQSVSDEDLLTPGRRHLSSKQRLSPGTIELRPLGGAMNTYRRLPLATSTSSWETTESPLSLDYSPSDDLKDGSESKHGVFFV